MLGLFFGLFSPIKSAQCLEIINHTGKFRMIILGESDEKKQVPMPFRSSGMKSYKVTLLSKSTKLHSTSGVY